MAQKEKFITVMAVLDDETQLKLQTLAEALEQQYGEDTKTKDIPYHITLGSYPVEDTGAIVSRIRNVAAETAPFEVQFAGMGHFGNVIRFLEPVVSEPLAALHRHFDSDYANGYPGWMPHVTLYRHSAPTELTGQWDLPEKAVITGIELGEFFPARKIVREAFRNE